MIDGPCAFGYGAITLYGPVSNPVPLAHGFLTAGRPVGAGAHAPATPMPQPPTGITRHGFGLIRFRSPLLTEYPFLQVLRCFTSLRTPRPKPVTAHDGGRVPPFGNPRIKAHLAAPRGISQPVTSFIGPVCQGIHHTPLRANTPAQRNYMPDDKSSTLQSDHKTIGTNTKQQFGVRTKSTAKTITRIVLARVHYPVLKPPRTTTASHDGTHPTAGHDGHRIAPRPTSRGGDPGAQKRIRTTPRPSHDGQAESQRSLPHQQPETNRDCPGRPAHTGLQAEA